MLREITGWLKEFLGVDDDIVAMGLLVMVLGAIANILTLDVKVKT